MGLSQMTRWVRRDSPCCFLCRTAYEYRDPVEFFSRTYVTEGMKGLLVQALRRVDGKDGEPVIQLKTAFGGGKTHSMLALYHLLRGRISVKRTPGIAELLQAAEISQPPVCRVAVLVGTALDPSKSKRPTDMPGITVNTLWGEMAYQLAKDDGNPKLYEYVKEADKKGVAPGSEAIKNLFDACGPCVILIDELVAYAKKLWSRDDLPAGTFDNLISFIQEITEAARASKNSLVVASIPESNIEIGGEGGRQALEAIEHTFGRMEAIWKPVAANEGFEIVRRRLFLNCKDPAGRDSVCQAFSRMYQENYADFPTESKEVEYLQRMRACYPIHPEIFDRLYEDWATIERFQKTRGVLRLMAAVVHDLWMNNDGGLLILPGSISLDVSNIRDELTRHVGDNWNAIVDHEVDGKSSIPYQKDQDIPRFGQVMAARRVARTIMLGSAPSSRQDSIRGLETSRIFKNMLAFIAPDHSMAGALREEVKRFLAWKSIQEDSVDLNLDEAQKRETNNMLSRSNQTVDVRLQETYCHLLVPYIDREVDLKTVVWDEISIRGGTDSIILKAARKMQQNEQLITQWAPALLKMQLDNLLWRDRNDLNVGELWKLLCTYCYLPRLASFEVLQACIQAGVNSDEYFAYADGIADGRYLGLQYNRYVGMIARTGYLVTQIAALKQIAAAQSEKPKGNDSTGDNGNGTTVVGGESGGGSTTVREVPPEPKPDPIPPKPEKVFRHFTMSTKLDNTRVVRNLSNLMDEVINHLMQADGADVEIRLLVEASIPGGASSSTVRTVRENCVTLRVDDFGFEE